jgi:methylenetetrahydrofolate dehydrogenase (NADP+)/methenyltetrahydrofolate cyclohydrolase
VLYSNEQLKISFKNYLKDQIATDKVELTLEIIEIAGNLASDKYIQIKQKIGEQIGIKVNLNKFDQSVATATVVNIIESAKTKGHGLIFQLPVPTNFEHLVNETPTNCDVDLLCQDNFKLWAKGFLPPTIGAIDLVLKQILNKSEPLDTEFNQFVTQKLDLKSKTVAVIGQGVLVGGPLLTYLKDRGATIISLNKKTVDPTSLTKLADILICAAGSPNLVDSNWFNKETIIIDASTSEVDGYLSGDIQPENIYPSNLLCPSPGGIGAITVLYLFYNLLKLHHSLKNTYES